LLVYSSIDRRRLKSVSFSYPWNTRMWIRVINNTLELSYAWFLIHTIIYRIKYKALIRKASVHRTESLFWATMVNVLILTILNTKWSPTAVEVFVFDRYRQKHKQVMAELALFVVQPILLLVARHIPCLKSQNYVLTGGKSPNRNIRHRTLKCHIKWGVIR
jgi:hypothetical protein